mmetsp:Transcript_39888/g.78651  ORF Transcript_39888/g.78651 Transcript_39888/m.78651 type:complete len:136 (-) Transcript_39888:325-732(-)
MTTDVFSLPEKNSFTQPVHPQNERENTQHEEGQRGIETKPGQPISQPVHTNERALSTSLTSLSLTNRDRPLQVQRYEKDAQKDNNGLRKGESERRKEDKKTEKAASEYKTGRNHRTTQQNERIDRGTTCVYSLSF